MERAVFLSIPEQSDIRTPRQLLNALPKSITWFLILDVEYMFPPSMRTPDGALEFLVTFNRCAYPRKITVNATHSLHKTPPPLRVSVHALKTEGSEG